MFSERANAGLPDPESAGSAGEDSARARALARSLEVPRARSVERLERFVAAARDLANAEGSATFTVAEVSRAAGLSLKSFYRCFAGKDDLLVTLLEEDSRLGAEILGASVGASVDPAGRVRAYVLGVFELLTHPGALGYAQVLVQEHRRLAEERPESLRAALAPMVEVLAAEIAHATQSGAARSSDPSRDAQTIFVLVLEGIHEVALGHAEPLEQASYLWRFCAAALQLDPEPPDQHGDQRADWRTDQEVDPR